MQNPYDCSPPLNYNGEFGTFQSGNTREVTSATSGTRLRAKKPCDEKRKIRDKKHRLKKKGEMQDSVGLNMLLIFILKTLLPNCPSCLRALLSMFLDEAAFCTSISGQVSNQLHQQNWTTMQADQMQNFAGLGGGGAGIPLSGSPANISAMDHELQRPRLNMHEKIFEIISQLLPRRAVIEAHQKEIFERIREGLFKSAQTNDEYINSHNQRHVQLVNSSSSIGTVMPTPGMSHSGNSNLMASSLDTTMIFSAGNGSMAPTVNAGTMLRTGGIHGNLSIGYEQSPANFATSSVGNTSSMGVQRMTSKMIPTPGFNDSNKSHCFMNMESSNNGTGGHSSFEFMVVSQPEQERQYVGGQNSPILHTLGSQMSNNVTSMMQQRPYGCSSDVGAMDMIVQLVNSSSSVGTMIPTPGMFHSGNFNLMASSVDTTMISSAGNGIMAPTVNAGTILPTGGIYGILPKEYEESPANFAISTVGNVSSMSEQRMTSKMIPIPGFNDDNNSHSYMYMESSNNGGGHSSVEPMVVSQPERQNQFVGSQNSLIPHTLGSQMSNNLTSMIQQRPYCFSDGGIEMIVNGMQLWNEPAGAEFESNLMNEVSAETIEKVNYQEYEAQLTQVSCFGEESGKPEPCDLSTANASRMWGR